MKNRQKDTILLIDDHREYLESMSDILEEEKFNLICCQTSQEAIDACERQDIHVCVLDLHLPDIDGLELMKKIKQIHPQIKIIIHTGYASFESAMEAINKEAFAYVVKGKNPEELILHVHRAFRKHYEWYNEVLEKEVSRRTEELSNINEQLRKEISERKQAEEKIKKSLREKEVLLQEIHHRVKNNMAIVVSILQLQICNIKNPDDLQRVIDIKNRIYTMAILHEKLYQTEDFSSIGFDGFIKDLARLLIDSYSLYPNQVELTIETHDLSLNLKKAVPCGLILNEILSNAFKHAFPDKKKGNINILFEKDPEGLFVLTIRDNGVGLPAGFDLQKVHSLGLQLLPALVKQLDGKLELDGSDGTLFRITFP